NAKKKLLLRAKTDADNLIASLIEQHNALSAQIDAEKFNSPDLAAHSKLSDAVSGTAPADAATSSVTESVRKTRSTADAKAATARVSVQVIAVLLILLVIFGPPSQLGTFLGLAGAGLTVALKDFIVSFLGWFVLMGRNGIRLGDWVEINGVTGEVVEIGLFHT